MTQRTANKNFKMLVGGRLALLSINVEPGQHWNEFAGYATSHSAKPHLRIFHCVTWCKSVT